MHGSFRKKIQITGLLQGKFRNEIAFDSFPMKRFSTTFCSLAEEERLGSEMHAVILQSGNKCIYRGLEWRVQAYGHTDNTKAPWARWDSLYSCNKISPFPSAKSQQGGFSPEMLKSKWVELKDDLWKRVWNIPHSPVCSCGVESKDGRTARGGKSRAGMAQSRGIQGRDGTEQGKARKTRSIPSQEVPAPSLPCPCWLTECDPGGRDRNSALEGWGAAAWVRSEGFLSLPLPVKFFLVLFSSFCFGTSIMELIPGRCSL